jgi:hypothetical protein
MPVIVSTVPPICSDFSPSRRDAKLGVKGRAAAVAGALRAGATR